MKLYIVRPGDTLYRIAGSFSVDITELIYINQLSDPDRIVPGLCLVIPTPSYSPGECIEVNAYDYPFVGSRVLDESLPYYTTLCPFSYSALPDGQLAPINDERLILSALENMTLPLLTVTNLTDEGFSASIGHAVLTDIEVQTRLFDSVLNLLKSKAYRGLNINFEYLYPFDRDSYSQFVAKAATLLHPMGYTVSTAITPKQSANQSGTLYAAHDYKAHGKYADRVILMTYEWGYTYSSPQAVSPVSRIKQVLDYAVTVIPREKIMMGFSNYAYDWSLPWKQGKAARVLSNSSAVSLAISRGAEIKYDESAAAPYFNYTDADGTGHLVWFEDPRSWQERLRLVEQYAIAGISFWTGDNLYRPGLMVLQDMYSIQKIM